MHKNIPEGRKQTYVVQQQKWKYFAEIENNVETLLVQKEKEKKYPRQTQQRGDTLSTQTKGKKISQTDREQRGDTLGAQTKGKKFWQRERTTWRKFSCKVAGVKATDSGRGGTFGGAKNEGICGCAIFLGIRATVNKIDDIVLAEHVRHCEHMWISLIGLYTKYCISLKITHNFCLTGVWHEWLFLQWYLCLVFFC